MYHLKHHFHLHHIHSHHKQQYSIDMCSGPVFSKMVRFAFPLMLSSILQLLFNAADIIVVGRFAGDNALAAVGCNTSLINLMTNLFIGMSIGANVLTARYIGADDRPNTQDTVHSAMLLSILSGVFLVFAGIFAAAPVLSKMQTPDEVLPLAATYLRIYCLGMPSMMVYNFGAAILRAAGDTRRPLNYLTIAGVINVILNLFFVIVLHLDVAGVAAATAISQTVSAVLILRCLMGEEGMIRLELTRLKMKKDKLVRILRIGIPAGLQGMLFSFSNIIIQSNINSFGAAVVAGSAAASNLEGFVYVSMNSFYQACISFTGQNMGAGKHERILRIMLCALAGVAITGIVMGNVMYLSGRTLLRMYTDSPAVMDAAMDRLFWILCPYFLCGAMEVVVGSLRGMGYSVVPMVVSLVGVCGLRLIWIGTGFRLARFHRPDFLYMTYPVSWIITCSTHLVCFFLIRRRLMLRQTGYGHVRYKKPHADGGSD